jgi:NAD(P)-dependent dehydrogenase (short-subunit alcohol dehydrogenase family)
MYMAKVAIVTGGARGIGRGCAHALARKGLDVALVDVLAPEMERTTGELHAMGRAGLNTVRNADLLRRLEQSRAQLRAHRICVARRAPSAIASNFAQQIDG